MVGDHGFNFSQPPRRERKTFEPPPWEHEQYDELARKAGQTEPPSAEDQAAEGAREESSKTRIPSHVATSDASEGAADAARDTAAGGMVAVHETGTTSKTLDDKKVAAMLIDLQVEEPPAMREVWKVAMVAATLVGVIGAVLVMWGVAALVTAKRTGQIGLFGGVVLLLFGAGFIGAALWLAERTLRQRGVL